MAIERLGDRLLEAGKVTSDDMERALTIHAQTGLRLGEVLVDLGAVSIHDVLSVVIEQHASNMSTGRLGDILVEQGVIDRIAVGKAVALQKRDKGPRRLLGEVLLDEGLITRAQLFDALERQLERRGRAAR